MSARPAASEGVPRDQWEWYGNAAHFICSYACRFHMATKVGEYIVSTVGQLWSELALRKIHARIHDPGWLTKNEHRRGDDFDHAYMQRFGFADVGYQRKFETMVFPIGPPCAAEGCDCGMPTLADANELDADIYNDAGAATRGHYAMCEKWAAYRSTATGVAQFDSLKWEHCGLCGAKLEPGTTVCTVCASEHEEQEGGS